MATFTNPHTATDRNTSLSSLTVTATTIGNLGIIAFSYDHFSPVMTSVTGGGTWATIGTNQNDSGNNQDAIWWWTIFTSSVTTISFSTAAACAVTFAEFNCDVGFAASPLDTQDTTKAFGSTTTSANAETSNNITPAATGELIVAAAYDQSGTAPTWTEGTGWTLAVKQAGVAGSEGSSAIEWKTGSAGSQNATWTIDKTGDSYTVQIAAFKPVTAAGAAVIGQPDLRRPSFGPF